MLKSTPFEEMFNATQKIIELVDKVPSEYKSDVFKALFDSYKQSGFINVYEEELSKLTQNGQILKEFIKEKRPQSNIERSLLFVYYLSKKLKIEEICIEQIEACYKLSGLETPGNLAQNIRDASSFRYGYIKSEKGGFVATDKGIAFCES